jgi:hypothetical protein
MITKLRARVAHWLYLRQLTIPPYVTVPEEEEAMEAYSSANLKFRSG